MNFSKFFIDRPIFAAVLSIIIFVAGLLAIFERRSVDLAQKLHQDGRSSYLDLLDAQRNLASAERSAVQLRGNRALTTVALIRSLGGGWE